MAGTGTGGCTTARELGLEAEERENKGKGMTVSGGMVGLEM